MRVGALRRAQMYVTMLSSVALPLVIAVVGGCYNVNMKNSENSVRYVELAIAQLRAPPTPETSALREWAVGLLDSQAPVKLSPAAKRQLMSNPLSVQLAGAAAAQAEARGNLSITSLKNSNGPESSGAK